MNRPAAPIADLASATPAPDARLSALCRQYEILRTQLADLNQRKGELETQLHGLEDAIASLRTGEPARSAPAASPDARVEATPSLRDLIDAMVREAGGLEFASNAWNQAALLCRSAPPLRRWLGCLASSRRLLWMGTAVGLVVFVLVIVWLLG
jgi:hypothetical protein